MRWPWVGYCPNAIDRTFITKDIDIAARQDKAVGIGFHIVADDQGDRAAFRKDLTIVDDSIGIRIALTEIVLRKTSTAVVNQLEVFISQFEARDIVRSAGLTHGEANVAVVCVREDKP